MSHEAFLEHLPTFEKVARAVVRYRRLAEPDVEDFVSAFHLHLMANDYAVLRKFRGQSSFATFVTSVATKFAIDYFRSEWGRFRPSAMAESLGVAAEELEVLVMRDGFALEEAIEVLRTRHREWSRTYLLGIWERLPPRTRRTKVTEEAAAAVPAPDTADATVEQAALTREVQDLVTKLESALTQVPARSSVAIRLKYFHGRTPAQIAETLQVSIPTVHRLMDTAMKQMAVILKESGVKHGDLRRLLGHAAVMPPPFLERVDSFLGPVRLLKRDG